MNRRIATPNTSVPNSTRLHNSPSKKKRRIKPTSFISLNTMSLRKWFYLLLFIAITFNISCILFIYHYKYHNENNTSISSIAAVRGSTSVTSSNSTTGKQSKYQYCTQAQNYIHNQTDSTSLQISTIPKTIHIILPIHIYKSCIPTRIYKQLISKWYNDKFIHNFQYSIYIHDVNDIHDLVAKYKFKNQQKEDGSDGAIADTNTVGMMSRSSMNNGEEQVKKEHGQEEHVLKHVYNGLFFDVVDRNDDNNNDIDIGERGPKYLHRHPCSSIINTIDPSTITSTNTSTSTTIDQTIHSLFYNDFAKLIVLWEYGGMVISDITYEPSKLLLQSLQNEQDELSFQQQILLQSANNNNNNNMITNMIQKHKQKQSKQTQLFTTNTTKFIIETNSNFQFTKHFLTSISHHPLLHHLLIKTIQRFQKLLFNSTTSSSFEDSHNVKVLSYHDESVWNQEIYKHFVTRFYTHKFRKPTQISPPNEYRFHYLFEMMNRTRHDGTGIYHNEKNDVQDDKDGRLSSTITILNRDMFDGQSLVKKIKGADDLLKRYSVPSSSSSSSSKKCVNLFQPIQTNVSSLLEVFGQDEKEDIIMKESLCPYGLQYIHSYLDPLYNLHNSTSPTTRNKIPPIIHLTGKTKCLSKAFYQNTQKWFTFPNHAVLYYDDHAVQRLFQNYEWKIFPQLKQAIQCINSGAGLADVFRYLLLWEYGGIYTDLDNAPGPLFNSSIPLIEQGFDSMFEVEKGKFPSQYFFAVSPHHPVMYFAVQNAIDRLITLNDVHVQHIPFVTGPGALKAAVVSSFLCIWYIISYWLDQLCEMFISKLFT
jgi:hypothetical protein